jgi:hypothetical protein
MKTIRILLALIFTLATAGIADAHDKPVHQHAVIEAYKLLKEEIAIHLLAPEFNNFISLMIEKPQHEIISSITGGAWSEDDFDIVFENYGISNYKATYSHFWNADHSDPYTKHKLTIPGVYESRWYNNAFHKIEIFWNGGNEFLIPWKQSLINCSVERNALNSEGITASQNFQYLIIDYNNLVHMYKNREYKLLGVILLHNGNWIKHYFSRPYEIKNSTCDIDIWLTRNILGRMAHLIADMSVPEHARVIAHPSPLGYSSVYEDYMADNKFSYGWEKALQQGGFIKVNNKNNPLKYLMYTTAQITDCYRAARRKPGTTSRDYFPGNRNYNTIDPHTGDTYNEMHQIIQSIPTSFGSYDTEMQHMANTSFVYAIRAIGGLFYKFVVDAGLAQENYIFVPGDYPTITEALNIASSGQTVYVSPGTYTINNDITVKNGVKLIISPGGTIRMGSGKRLFVSGTLFADGTPSKPIMFTRSGSSGTWGGIRLNAGSTAGISRSTIQYASTGISVNGSNINFSIYTCTIRNNSGSGIYLYNTGLNGDIVNSIITANGNYGIEITTASPRFIDGNTITYNTNGGIVAILGSAPYIFNNTIKYNGSRGVAGAYDSPVKLYRLSTLRGWNIIEGNDTQNGYQLTAQYGSHIVAGTSTDYGWNSIIDPGTPSCTIYLQMSSSIEARGNWWGQYTLPSTGPTGICMSGSGNSFQWSPILLANPNYSKIVSSGDNTGGADSTITLANYSQECIDCSFPGNSLHFDLELFEALDYVIIGEFERALAIYKRRFAEERTIEIRKYVLRQIADVYRSMERTDFIDFLNSEIRPGLRKTDELYAVTLMLEGIFMLNEEQYEASINRFRELEERFTHIDDYRRVGLFAAGLISLEHSNDNDFGSRQLGKLAALYPDDILSRNALQMYGDRISHAVDRATIESADAVPVEFALHANYPNPFNPTTQIRFDLPIETNVRLDVFDILGRRVASLVDGRLAAGSHTVNFDASRLSSGLYIYRIETPEFSKTRQMMLVR